jgi:hypothetical protein
VPVSERMWGFKSPLAHDGCLVSANGNQPYFARSDPSINSFVSLGDGRVIPDG